MSSADGFHPDLKATGTEHNFASLRTRVHHVKSSGISSDTAQTAGMQRFAAISGASSLAPGLATSAVTTLGCRL